MTTENNVMILTDDGIEQHTNLADIAEVMDGKLQIADLDGNRELVPGTIFGASGRWKMWHENDHGEIERFVAEKPLTMPGDFTRFWFDTDENVVECRLKQERVGRIKRLRRADL
ncbi:hypothetical protein [Halapricum desulfuricans]|uniref:Uncharacterized protein n=1 Tax=Halapricum desulfuricans TaxID=2841257 RepID=A0A897N5T6_9EURY|nr:hypothetical protein [Halapricum desulfuricans]QSG06345.1 hypothetical protein HSR121_2012 [Halapricum desulfuricans]